MCCCRQQRMCQLCRGRQQLQLPVTQRARQRAKGKLSLSQSQVGCSAQLPSCCDPTFRVLVVVMQRHDAPWPCPSSPAKGPMNLFCGKQFTDCGMAAVGCEMACVKVCLLSMCKCVQVHCCKRCITQLSCRCRALKHSQLSHRQHLTRSARVSIARP